MPGLGVYRMQREPGVYRIQGEPGDLLLVRLVQQVQRVPMFVLIVTGSGPDSCLCQLSAMMFTVNNAFSQTAYGLGRVWHSRGTDSRPDRLTT